MSNPQDDQIVDDIIDVYEKATFEGIKNPKGELNELYHSITNNYIIWTSGYRNAFRKSYSEDMHALRKSLLGMIFFSNQQLQNKVEKYPSLKDDLQKKKELNKDLIRKLEGLW